MGVYTDDILRENFNLISNFIENAGGRLERLESDVLVLLARPTKLTVQSSKNSKLALVAVCAWSAYLGYKVGQTTNKQVEQSVEATEAVNPPKTEEL